MLKENLIMLRTIHGFSQEEIAGRINISRQAYAKWESGATIPDLEKCSLGDYVDVFYVALGIVSRDVEIVSLTYDVLADAVTEMELGEIKTTYAQVLNQTFGGAQE